MDLVFLRVGMCMRVYTVCVYIYVYDSKYVCVYV
jgi:hypothetical protein